MENIVRAGSDTILAHLRHLQDHGEIESLQKAIAVLREKGIPIPKGFEEPLLSSEETSMVSGCPGARTVFSRSKASPPDHVPSALRQWPVQLHLVSPKSPSFREADVLLAADCTAYAVGDFHHRFMTGKAIAIACPKLDDGQEIYLAKLEALIRDAKIHTLTVVIMEVPCCGGLLRLVLEARNRSGRNLPIKRVVMGIQGHLIEEKWV